MPHIKLPNLDQVALRPPEAHPFQPLSTPPQPPREEPPAHFLRAALFVDFDNVYSGLRNQDPRAADFFAKEPALWLRWLESAGYSGTMPASAQVRRKFLVRRCYLNPQSFGDYRPYFVRNGFQVVDCPSLTSRSKNGADIQIVMDVLDSLEHPTRFDEFVLLSTDSDFTPLLLRLRAHDRRTTVLAVGLSAAAYRAACDVLLTEEDFIQQGLEEQPEPMEEEVSTEPLPSGVSPLTTSDDLKARAVDVIRTAVAESPHPLTSGAMAHRLRTILGSEIAESWRQAGRFRDFITGLGDTGVQVDWRSPGYFYDPDRHQLPITIARPDEFGAGTGDLPQRIHNLTDAPLITPEQYAALFKAIAEEVSANGYSLTRTSQAVRDALRVEGHAIRREDIAFVLRGLVYYGYRLSRGLRPDAALDMARAFRINLENYCRLQEIPVTANEQASFDAWIVGGFLVDAAVLSNDHSGWRP